MNKIKLYYPLIAMFALFVTSCQKEYDELIVSDTAIEVYVPWNTDNTTRGMDPLQNENLENFGFSAIWNYDGVSTNQWYISELPIVKDKTAANPWVLNPTAYWPIVGDLSFFFHAPSNVSHSEIKFIETTTGYPQVEFTPVTADVADQIDFCMGVPVMHATAADGAVPVQLNHALTQVLFQVNYTGKIPPGFFMLIDEIRVKGLVGTKKASYTTTSPYITWEDESEHTADSVYVLKRTSNHLRNDSIRMTTGQTPDTYQIIYNSAGRLYLLPQTLGSDARLEVVYGFYYNYGASPTMIAQFAKEISLPDAQVWPIGKTVTYKVTVDVGESAPLKLTTTITDWVASGNNHSEVEYE